MHGIIDGRKNARASRASDGPAPAGDATR